MGRGRTRHALYHRATTWLCTLHWPRALGDPVGSSSSASAFVGPWLGVFGAGSQDMEVSSRWLTGRLEGVGSAYLKSGSWVAGGGSGCQRQRQSDR
jgi:hypothetical protein